MICPSCKSENDAAAARCAVCGHALVGSRGLGPGTLIASRYEILGQLGAGGMGMVFRAHDRALDETVALKILQGAADPGLANRFRSEIKLAWKVRHRNVCGIHEYGEDGDLLYISMELVEGRDLRALLQENGALLWEDAYEVALQVAEGLQAIHDAGVIHRDLKTSNIMRDSQGVVRLMDFGIAKVWREEGRPGITSAGQVVGSPEYMSPEQVRGRPVDFRSDIYSLGVVIYEVFTGRVPFRAETPVGTMLLHLEKEPPLGGSESAQIPAALLPVLRKALAKDPASRHSSCREMIAALREARAALEKQTTDVVPVPERPSAAPAAADEDRPTQTVEGTAPDRGPGARVPAAQTPDASPSPAEARLLVAPLLKALRHADTDVRAGAAQALGRVGPDAPGAIPALVDALKDAEGEVRRQAAQALGLAGAEAVAAISALTAAQDDEDERVRDAATSALARLTPQAAPPPAPPPPPSLPEASAWESAAVAPPAAEPVPTPAPPPAATRLTTDEQAAWETHPKKKPPRPAPRDRAWVVAALVFGLAVVAWLVLGVLARAKRPTLAAPAQSLPLPTPWPSAPATPSPAPAPARASPTTPPRRAPILAEAMSPRVPPPVTTAAATPPTTLAPDITLQAAAPPSEPPPTVAEVPASPAPSARVAPLFPPGHAFELRDPGVVPPVCERCPMPPYPTIAERRGVVGSVTLRVLVDEQGHVVSAQVTSGPELLHEGAVKGVRQWKYRPGTRDGVTVRVWILVNLRFELGR